METMDPTVQGILFLVATILFVIGALTAYQAKALWATVVSAGLAFFSFVFMWNAFAAS